MLSTYILLYVLITSQGAASMSVQFDSKEACEAAAAELKANVGNSLFRNEAVLCVSKS